MTFIMDLSPTGVIMLIRWMCFINYNSIVNILDRTEASGQLSAGDSGSLIIPHGLAVLS